VVLPTLGYEIASLEREVEAAWKGFDNFKRLLFPWLESTPEAVTEQDAKSLWSQVFGNVDSPKVRRRIEITADWLSGRISDIEADRLLAALDDED
jgi:hypothetical protein